MLVWTGVARRVEARTSPVIPAQFVAKTYTEALGRAPGQDGWRRAIAYFAQAGCSAANARGLAVPPPPR